MKTNIEIKNFAKLKVSNITLNKLTVFAGVNNTGKSLTSKLIYSIFKSIEINPIEIIFFDTLVRLIHYLERFEFKDATKIRKEISMLRSIRNQIMDSNYDVNMRKSEITKIKNSLSRSMEKINRLKIDDIVSTSRKRAIIRKNKEISHEKNQYFDYIKNYSNKLLDLTGMSSKELIILSIEKELKRQIRNNFLVHDIYNLADNKEKPIYVNINNQFIFTINPDSEIKLNEQKMDLYDLQTFSNLYYIDTHPIWKLDKSFIVSSVLPGRTSRNRISFPSYVEDLLEFKNTKSLIDNNNFSKLFKAINKSIGGKFINNDGEIKFKEKGKSSIDIAQASSGVIQIGLLGLLLENNLIDENSILIIDEPETHLHPNLQVVMIKTLIKIADLGAAVIVATHSNEILKYIEKYLEYNEEKEDVIDINHFNKNGINDNRNISQYKLMKDIQKEISEAYYLIFTGDEFRNEKK